MGRIRARTAAFVVVGLHCCYHGGCSSSSSSSVDGRRTRTQPHTTAAASTVATSSSNDIRAAQRASQFLRNRCSNEVDDDEPAVWVYTGSLMDPLTGRKIAAVEGLELVQTLAETTTTKASKSTTAVEKNRNDDIARFRRRCGKLQIAKALHSDAAPSFCGTLLSRKMFCYTSTTEDEAKIDPQSSPSPSLLLHKLRKRPGGPVTTIPVDQAVTVYDTAVSMVVPSSSSSDNKSNDNWLLHSEWPSGQAVWSTAQLRLLPSKNNDEPDSKFPASKTKSPDHNDDDDDAVEFTIYSRLRSRSKTLQPEDLRPPEALSSATTVSPKRSAWIQFGGSQTEQQGKFGARESYRYSSSSASRSGGSSKVQKVRYTRYGEAPVWYGPGRMCQLELTGRKLSKKEEDQFGRLVPTAKEAVRQHIPHFWDFGRHSNRPAWVEEDSSRGDERKRTTRDKSKDDDPAFCYYADALNKAFSQTTSDDDLDEAINNNNNSSSKKNQQRESSLVEHRRYYNDLAVGRVVDRFRTQPPIRLSTSSSSSSSSNPTLEVLHKIHETGRRVAGIVRAATSISIGGGGE